MFWAWIENLVYEGEEDRPINRHIWNPETRRMLTWEEFLYDNICIPEYKYEEKYNRFAFA